MPSRELQVKRRERLAQARLYFVCPELGEAAEARLPELVRAAVAGGADIVQLREKELDEDRLVAAARALAPVCDQAGALLIVNDSPLAALEAGADGVHVGQDDTAPAAARELVGPELLIGLSTHAPAEIDAAEAAPVDYIAVGPVHETPTKPGRPAVGIELVRYAAQHAHAPFFAIGGLHADNLAPVLQAGARRAVVLRAISDAPDPEAAARELRGRLDAHAPDA
ncbi:MAG TPA: thiamine phosphate synthase [Solirubrobacteraceae bacterium]|jgi:thiamine-phosphate pyrophosphorylase|nr:thiamine phosphate synthase [Solirubrobacteraceae bacterium]